MIHIVGIGPGNVKLLTEDAKNTIEKSELIIGHKRHIDSIESIIEKKNIRIYEKITNIPNIIKEFYNKSQSKLNAYRAFEENKGRVIDNCNFKTYINKENKKIQYTENITVLASGDPILYGISNYLKNTLSGQEIQLHPGISSVNYLFNKINLSMNDVYITSTHGRNLNENLLLYSSKTAFFTDSEKGPYFLAKYYLENKKDPQFIIGENLSYKEEKITVLKASQINENMKFEMAVVIILLEI